MSDNTKKQKGSNSAAKMPGSKQKARSKGWDTVIKNLDDKIKKQLDEFRTLRSGRHCYPLLLHNTSIRMRVVDDVFDDLRTNFNDCGGKLDVIIDSSGGDIDCAYNLALLLRKFGASDLTFFIPRWAKSAATLLVCGGNLIMMSPIAELGPVDPQITEVNPLEQRLERFSPLHIEATLGLIRDEFKGGNEKLAKGLLERLQFPLTLGSFKKSLDIGKEYLRRLLATRMLSGGNKEEEAKRIAATLTEGYADHGFCINVDEAIRIGLKAEELSGKGLDIIWEIHKLSREKERIKEEKNRKEVEEKLKNLPPGLIEKLPSIVETPSPIPEASRNIMISSEES